MGVPRGLAHLEIAPETVSMACYGSVIVQIVIKGVYEQFPRSGSHQTHLLSCHRLVGCGRGITNGDHGRALDPGHLNYDLDGGSLAEGCYERSPI